MSISNAGQAGTKPKRLLCIHPHGSNPAYFEHLLLSVINSLEDDFEFVFLRASFIEKNSFIAQYYDMEFYSWFNIEDKSNILSQIQQSL